MPVKWNLQEPDPKHVDLLCKEMDISPLAAAILVNRGIICPDRARRFIFAGLGDLHPPFDIQDMDRAVTRIHRALNQREKILIFGDYDVDGVTSTVMLLRFFEDIGADVAFHIPHRIREGYGLKSEHIQDVAVRQGIRLIITVDCGSSSHDAVATAAVAGIDVIVTDHHNVSGDLPRAAAVVNPKRRDCRGGFEDLAGVGVAFCLLIALRKHLRAHDFWPGETGPNLKQWIDLVALGTFADMVPLHGDNRILARTGLDLIRAGRRPGIAALIRAAGLKSQDVDAEDIGFRLGPRLNAAGRLDHAKRAVELLRSTDTTVAMAAARSLDRLNADRQRIEQTILADIETHLGKDADFPRRKSIVLAHADWHVGVLGIVASRLARKYYRPTVLISLEQNMGKGSARSIPGFDLYAAMAECRPLFVNFGGHAQAAGLEIEQAHVKRFQRQFEEVVEQRTLAADFVRQIVIDHRLPLEKINDRLIDEIDRLRPFGTGNPEPLFMAEDVRVVSARIVGAYHRKMTLAPSDGSFRQVLDAMEFNVDPQMPPPDRFERIAYRLGWNVWNGRKSAQLTIQETVA